MTRVKTKLVLCHQEITIRKICKSHSTGLTAIEKPSHAPAVKLASDVADALPNRSTGPEAASALSMQSLLEFCRPNLVEFLPVFLEASTKDDISLTELVLNSRAARLSFLATL